LMKAVFLLIVLLVLASLVASVPCPRKTIAIVEHVEHEIRDYAKADENNFLFTLLTLAKNLATGHTAAVQIIPQNITIKGIEPYLVKPTLIAVLLRSGEESKRKTGDPYITLEDDLRSMKGLQDVLVPYMNQAASMLEKSLNHTIVHAMQVGILTPEIFTTSHGKDLWAVFDYAAGRILIRPEFFTYLIEETNGIPPLMEMEQMYQSILDQMPKKATIAEMTRFIGDIPSIIGQSVWVCFACAVVLGTALPIIYNYGIDWISQEICIWYKFTPDQCVQLRVEALMFALVLVIPAAFIVFKVCKLSTCHATTQVVKKLGGPSIFAYMKSLL